MKYLTIERSVLYRPFFIQNKVLVAAIKKFQEKKVIHLLVMVQNKHTLPVRLVIEPVIKKIAFHITIPFMISPNQTES